MANPIVRRVDSLEPPIEEAPPGQEYLDQEVTVHFAGGRTARLNPADPRSFTYARILGELSASRSRVYVELDADKRIERLLLPKKVRVKDLHENEAGDFEVELEISHGRHLLKTGTESAKKALALLRKARADGTWVLVTETLDDHVIFHVREIPAAQGAPPAEAEEELALDFSSLREIGEDRAQELFRIVTEKTCSPQSPLGGCIPFKYPDDGCWPRAHAMCHVIADAGEQCGKVWSHAQALFPVSTPNHPDCRVEWRWHVVPVLRVKRGDTSEAWVIDPSLFEKAVPQDDWVAAQGVPLTLVQTIPTVYYRDLSSLEPLVGPFRRRTERELAALRAELRLRSMGQGAPPYAHCPVPSP